MKKAKKCPKCESSDILKIDSVAANEETGYLQRQPTFKLAVIGNGTGGRSGELEAYACQECLYVEFYLKQRIWVDGNNVTKLNQA